MVTLPFTCIVIFCDGFFDKQFDYNESDKAEAYLNYCQRNYRGKYTRKSFTDKEFAELMGIVEKIITTPELSHAYGTLIRR